jgi:hypothetical protein
MRRNDWKRKAVRKKESAPADFSGGCAQFVEKVVQPQKEGILLRLRWLHLQYRAHTASMLPH